MRRILIAISASIFWLGSGTIFAETEVTPSSLDKNWTCSTNASSSAITAEQDADKQMANTPRSAAEAYAFASKHCRDCTKITCEYNED